MLGVLPVRSLSLKNVSFFFRCSPRTARHNDTHWSPFSNGCARRMERVVLQQSFALSLSRSGLPTHTQTLSVIQTLGGKCTKRRGTNETICSLHSLFFPCWDARERMHFTVGAILRAPSSVCVCPYMSSRASPIVQQSVV